MYLSREEQQLMENCRYLSTGGIDLFWMYWSAPEGATVEMAREDLIHVPPDEYDPPLLPHQFVPLKPFPWATRIAHGDETDVCIVGGVGCLDVNALLYDADRQQYVSLKYYIQHNERPAVLSYTGTEWKKVVASVPFYAGTGPMLRVTLRSGKTVDVSPAHKFLTPLGYKRTADLVPGDAVIAPRSLPATLADESANVPRCSEIALGCSVRCSVDYRQCDVQPRRYSSSAEDAAPLLSDAIWHIRCSLDLDNPLVPVLQRNSGSQSQTNNDSTHLVVLHPEEGLPYRERVASAVPARPALADRVLAESYNSSSQYWKDVLANESIDLKPTASSYVGNGLIGWSYSVHEHSLPEFLSVYLKQFLRLNMSHADQPVLESRLESSNIVCLPCQPPGDKWNSTTYDEVVKIEYIGERDYYDIHVPIYNNYVAEGVVNHNSGKTLNMVLIAGYYACMLPNFRYLGTAPVSWQAELSYKDFLQQVLDFSNQQSPRRIMRFIEKVSLRPYPTIHFVNGSTMEFKSLDKDAASILTWSGDMISVDQAEDSTIDLDSVTGNLGTRLRGQVGGRPRLGKLIFMANSAYNPALWEMYDRYEANPDMLAMVITSYDNPVLTKRSLRDMERRFRDKEEAKRMMMSVRPLPKGKEFTGETIAKSQDESLDAIMSKAQGEGMPGYIVEGNRNAGTTRWIIPPQKDHLYILAGDPGQANPPYRNSAVAMVFDVTYLPKEPATLAAFDWIYGYGSYWPFINKMLEFYETYNPYIAAFDSTGTQKAFDDLGVLDNSKNWLPLNFNGLKMHMVLCAKILLSRGIIKIPKAVYSIWNQLLMWHMPDTNLQQDIASTIFMAAYVVNQLLPRKVEDDDDEKRYVEEHTDRWGRNRSVVKRGRVHRR